MYNQKNNGPKMEPCGTPRLLRHSFIFTSNQNFRAFIVFHRYISSCTFTVCQNTFPPFCLSKYFSAILFVLIIINCTAVQLMK